MGSSRDGTCMEIHSRIRLDQIEEIRAAINHSLDMLLSELSVH
jgi:hypothetical protein